MGARTIKWTTLDPCKGLSKSLYKRILTLCFLRNRIVNIKNNDLLSHAIYVYKKNLKENIHNLEEGISGVQVADIEQLIV